MDLFPEGLGNVYCNTVSGKLTFDQSGVRWTADSDGSNSTKVDAKNIKTTFLSKREKGMAKLKMVLHDGSSLVLDFSRVGTGKVEKCFETRDLVRDAIHAIGSTPAPATAPPPDVVGVGRHEEEARRPAAPPVAQGEPGPSRDAAGVGPDFDGSYVRRNLLERDPRLRRLYEELVFTQVISDQEFWDSHANDEARLTQTLQKDGRTSKRLKAMMDQAEEGESTVLKLTAEMISQIFLENPALKEVYDRKVPTEWSAKKFWSKYFKYQRIRGPGHRPPKEDAEGKESQEVIRALKDAERGEEGKDSAARARELRERVAAANPANDLTLLEQRAPDVQVLGDGTEHNTGEAGGYGSMPWSEVEGHLGEVRESRYRFREQVAQYNRHSEKVIAHLMPVPSKEEAAQRRKRALADTALEHDLEATEPVEYLVAPSAPSTGPPTEPTGDSNTWKSAVETLHAELSAWSDADRGNLPLPAPSCGDARAAILGVRWEKQADAEDGVSGLAFVGSRLPRGVADLTDQCYELLRHVWGALEPWTDRSADKVARLLPVLKRHHELLTVSEKAMPRDDRQALVAAAIRDAAGLIRRGKEAAEAKLRDAG